MSNQTESGTKRTIGVLTSGGDAPGMNAAVRAVVRMAISMDFRVVGFRRGYHGMVYGDYYEMNLRSVSEILHRGGTVLNTARCPEFMTEKGIASAVSFARTAMVDCLVVIGGDGSYRGALALSERGLPCIGIPGTIDNDITSTDYTIGFDTAMNTAIESIDKLRDTAQSHEMCSVVEVMGRHAGHLALEVGVACGATAVLVPEIPLDINRDVIGKMIDTKKTGKKHFIVVVAEGVAGAGDIARLIEAETGVGARATVLGHVQRGGSPTVRDRVLATKMGCYAVELFSREVENRIIGIRGDQLAHYPIKEALEDQKMLDFRLYAMTNRISI